MTDERTPLDAEIRARIAQTGPMTVAEFMATCLYDPQHGYYGHRSPFGAAGDFVTAPEISQMFGELVGLWAAEVWQAIGKPDPVALIEFGPGRGTMMADVLRAVRAAPDFRRAVRVHLIEMSLDLQARQRATLSAVDDVPLHWHATIDDVPRTASIIVANEFFDALPIFKAERTAPVDFEALGKAAQEAGARVHGPVEQGTWLKRLGIEARAAALLARATEPQRADIAAALRRLTGTGPNQMGSLFKAIAFSAPAIAHLPGFAP